MKGKKSFIQNIASVLSLIFLFSWITIPRMEVKAEEKPSIAADAMAIVTGDFLKAQDLGQDWSPQLKELVMKEGANGIYFFEVPLKASGEFQYKIAMNGSWDESYGENGQNIAFKVEEEKQIQFFFDYKNKIIKDSINHKEFFKEKATLVGNLGQSGAQDWNPAQEAFDLNYIGEGFFSKKFSLKAGNYEYKIAYDHKWDNGEVGANVSFKLDRDEEVTFLANPYTGICVDSINNKEILNTYGLIGTIRNAGDNNWNEKLEGFDLSYLGKGKYIYSGFIPKNSEGTAYEYKVVVNRSWEGGGIPSSGNISVDAGQDGKYLVIIYDIEKEKVYDSINNPREVAIALGLKKEESSIKSPTINPNGTVTFNFKADEAEKVYLAGSMTNWADNKKLMTKDQEGVWSITLRLGDQDADYEYKFIVGEEGWTVDPLNENIKNGNSLLAFPKYEGRKVVIAGTIQAAAGEGNWTPGSEKTRMTYKGNGIYELTIKNVPAGRYEYKVAMGSWDPENYGLNGEPYGPNIPLVVNYQRDVTFIYNDDTHYVVDSMGYEQVNAYVTGSGIKETLLKDQGLTGIYSGKLELAPNLYEDLRVEIRDTSGAVIKIIKVSPIEVKGSSKVITINYDPLTGIVFNDSSTEKITVEELYFNSREIEYKAPFGAVKDGEEITFNLKTLKDEITLAKMVLTTPEGSKIVDMKKNGLFDDNHDKWTYKESFTKLGTYKYYFIVSNGSDVKAYGDEDGFFGPGKGDDLGKVKAYEFNIYSRDFKTPDWMKDAVIYQIFPDRFFDGDANNNFLQKYARGYAPYEFYRDWYEIPENPNLAYEKDEKGNVKLDQNGKPIIKEGYTGAIGDGYLNIWCNEMYGGDLAGINAKLDYLQALGVTVLYMTPISKSISNHRYDTTDYREVDPLLGNMEDFVNLSKAAKERGMHIILDGVYNHVSDDSVYFDRYGKYMAKNKPLGAYQYWSRVYDLMNEKGISQQQAEKEIREYFASIGITDLTYKDWFKVNNIKVDKGTPAERYEYEGWWGYDSMPVIQSLGGSEYNIDSWASEIIDGEDSNTRYWLRQGSNGWRLDVANEVSDDTWKHFRKAVKEEGDHVIIGEIWNDASQYLLGDMYDSVMNYRFRESVLGFLRDNKSAAEITNQLELIREQYPEEAFKAMMNLVDSHDTERILTALDGIIKDNNDGIIAKEATEKARKLQQLVPLIQMTYPGAPFVYYGDEAGMVGAKDPDDRRAMAWGKGHKETVERYALLANIRNNNEVLRTGDISPILLNNNNVLAYERFIGEDRALILVNRGEAISNLEVKVNHIAEGTKLTDAIKGGSYNVVNGKVTISLGAMDGVILLNKVENTALNHEALKDAYDPSFIVKNIATPKTDKQIIEELNKLGNKENTYLLSTMEEEITKEVLKEIAKRNITSEFQRDEVLLTIRKLDKVIAALEGTTGLIIKASNKLKNQELAKELEGKHKSSLFKTLRLESNLPSEDFGTKIRIKVQVDKGYEGKILYVHYLNKEGKDELYTSVVKNGAIEFITEYLGDYIISSDKIKLSEKLHVQRTIDLDSFNQGEKAEILIKAHNNHSSSKETTLIVALYDASTNKLIDMATVNKKINSGESGELKASLNIPSQGKYVVRYFVWENLKLAKPYIKSETIIVN